MASACKSKGTRWNIVLVKVKVKYPYTQRINCCHDLQQMRNPLPNHGPFTTVNCFIRLSVLFFSSRRCSDTWNFYFYKHYIPSFSFTFASTTPSCSFTFASIIPSCSFTFARVISLQLLLFYLNFFTLLVPVTFLITISLKY